MTVGTFQLKFYTNTGISYIQKVKDKLTKNYGEKDNELITDFIPQMRNSDGSISRLSPVQSYENYVNLLDKGVEYLWQRSKPKIPKSPADT